MDKSLPILFSAVGLPRSGRETSMVFLGEELLENGYHNLKVVTPDNIGNVLQNYSKALLRNYLEPKQRLIMIMAKVENEESYNFIGDYPGLILLSIKSNPYKEGAGHLRATKDITEITPEWIVRSPGIPVRNDDSLRLFRFQIKDVFKYFIQQHKTWKHIYG